MEEGNKTFVVSITTGTVVKILVVLGIIAALFYFRELVLVLLMAILIASAIQPIVGRLQKWHIPRALAVVLIYLVMAGLIFLFFYLVLPSFLQDLSDFFNMLPKYIKALNVKSKGLGSDFTSWQTAIQGLSGSQSIGQTLENITTTLTTNSGSALGALTTIFGGALSFVLIVVLSFYFAVSQGGVEEFLRLVTPLKHEKYVINLWHRAERKITRWFQGQLVLAVIVGILVYIGLLILGVKNAFVLAIISAVFEIVPIIGPFIGAAPGVLVASLQGGLTFGVIVSLMYVVVQQIESNVIYPLVVKKVLDVPPIVVMVALVIGGQIGGILGIVLSVPAAAIVMEYLGDVTERRTVARAKFENHV